MQVETVVARDEALGLEDILTELIDVACCTREIASRLDTT